MEFFAIRHEDRAEDRGGNRDRDRGSQHTRIFSIFSTVVLCNRCSLNIRDPHIKLVFVLLGYNSIMCGTVILHLCTVAPPLRINACLTLPTCLPLYCSSRLLHGVRNNFPQWREPVCALYQWGVISHQISIVLKQFSEWPPRWMPTTWKGQKHGIYSFEHCLEKSSVHAYNKPSPVLNTTKQQ